MTKEEEEKKLPWSDICDQTKAWTASNETNACIAIFTQKGHRSIGTCCFGSPKDYVEMLASAFERHPVLLIAAKTAIYAIGQKNEDQES